MPDKHFVYGGSNAHIWFYCDAAGQLSRMVPYSEAGDAAKRGTRIHDFAYKIYNKYPVQGDEEEIAIAKKYIEDCNNISPNINLETMCSFDCNFGGTIDGWSIKDKTLYMWDLKTGKSKLAITVWSLVPYLYSISIPSKLASGNSFILISLILSISPSPAAISKLRYCLSPSVEIN